MKYPNIKPQQGEQSDINQRRYPSDTIELAGPRNENQDQSAASDKAGENAAINDPQPKNRAPAK